jgi:hypothetical protein
MDWNGTKGILSLDISWYYVSNISSIHLGNPKLLVCQYRVPKLGINGGKGKWPKMIPNVLNKYLVTLEFPFAYLNKYGTPCLTLWASYAPFSFGESESSLGVRVYLRFLRELRI